MSALEHIMFVLFHAVTADEVSKAELLRIIDRVMAAGHEVNNTKELEQLSVKIGKRFERVIYPKPNQE